MFLDVQERDLWLYFSQPEVNTFYLKLSKSYEVKHVDKKRGKYQSMYKWFENVAMG